MMMHCRSQKAFLPIAVIVWIIMMANLIYASRVSANEDIIFEAGETTFQPPPSLSPNANDNDNGSDFSVGIGMAESVQTTAIGIVIGRNALGLTWIVSHKMV
jgi:hypothetical protein